MKLKDLLFWRKGKLHHDASKCEMCGLCARRCPHKALAVDKEWKIKSMCMRCERCVRECPKGALKIE